MGKELFLQTLKILSKEMLKRYNRVDPLMLMNFREIEKISESIIAKERVKKQ